MKAVSISHLTPSVYKQTHVNNPSTAFPRSATTNHLVRMGEDGHIAAGCLLLLAAVVVFGIAAYGGNIFADFAKWMGAKENLAPTRTINTR